MARTEDTTDGHDESAHDGRPVAFVLVEGASDAAAVTTLADRYGIMAGRIRPVVAFGVTNFGRILRELTHDHRGATIVGLYDQPEESVVRRAVRAAGLGAPTDGIGLEHLGFHACVDDLEEEFIRAIGVEGVTGVLEREDELLSFRRFQLQPAQRGRPPHEQLRRFMGTKATRKIRYGRHLAAAIDLAAVPRPLRRVTVDLVRGRHHSVGLPLPLR